MVQNLLSILAEDLQENCRRTVAPGGAAGPGAIGYQPIEGWTFFDGLYMTVITVASVVYGETHPLSNNGWIFTLFLILSGVGILLYSISMITASIVEGELTDVLKRMKMDKAIARLNGHCIVCGDSRTGRYAIEKLRKTKRPFVVT